MYENVNVFEITTIYDSIKDIQNITHDVYRLCDEEINACNKVLNETIEEECRSQTMLNAAKLFEETKLVILIATEAELAAAAAEEATAIASGNPIAIAVASARVADAFQKFSIAKDEYDQARRHREALEYRHELAIRCVNIANEMLDTIQVKFNYYMNKIRLTSEKGVFRLNRAFEDLKKYVSKTAPEVLAEIEKWDQWEPDAKVPVSPKTLHGRLNISNEAIKAILTYLYATDENFRASVNAYRQHGLILGYRDSAELKIRKNMSGRLSEEIVIRAFGPLGESVETQGRTFLEDGSYTKTDLVVKNLKVPIILGKGERMGAREGGNLAIEVKAGKKEYIYSQKEHMRKQALGHANSNVSCTVCTRDIKELSPEKEEELRKAMIEAGSPLLGMLPTKAELDRACIEFVFGDDINV